jgi:hypothetical protein
MVVFSLKKLVFEVSGKHSISSITSISRFKNSRPYLHFDGHVNFSRWASESRPPATPTKSASEVAARNVTQPVTEA